MAANTFGQRIRITTFGESHGPALGVIVDGLPAGVEWKQEVLDAELARRRPGKWSDANTFQSARQEPDVCEVLSGVFEGSTLGTPIAIIVRNQNARSQDYQSLSPRPGHADQVWRNKFGHVDPRGGGRSSGRETVSRVMAGAISQMFVRQLFPQIVVRTFVNELGPHRLSDELKERFLNSKELTDVYPARMPFLSEAELSMLADQAKTLGESFGGKTTTWIQNPPKDLGQPVFHKLKNDLASAAMSIGAVVGVEFGEKVAENLGSGIQFHEQSHRTIYGGIQGGISTGEPITYQCSVKPTSSIQEVAKKGRHDPSIVVRMVPVLDAMTWIVLADHILWSRTDRI